MKGLKWRSIVKFVVFCMSLFVVPVFISEQTSAASLETSSFDLNSSSSYNGSYSWSNGLLYNQMVDVAKARRYQFTTANINPTGNFATLHFETNIVAESFSYNYINYVNLSQMSLYACSSSLGQSLSIRSSGLAFAITDWTSGAGAPRRTLTVYGDVVLGDIPSGNQQIVCAIGSDDYWFFVSDVSNVARMWFEQNPMTILYTNDESEALLRAQVEQNAIMIEGIGQTTDAVNNASENIQNKLDEQNQKDDQDREDMENASDDASASGDDSQSQAEATGTTLLKAFTDFVGALTSSTASDCVVNMNMGNLNLGNVDLCSLSIPQPLQAVASIMLIGFCVPLSIATARKLIGLFRSFQS